MEIPIGLPVYRNVERSFEPDDMIALVRRAGETPGLGIFQYRQP